jgi:hypothetical protein
LVGELRWGEVFVLGVDVAAVEVWRRCRRVGDLDGGESCAGAAAACRAAGLGVEICGFKVGGLVFFVVIDRGEFGLV